MLYNPDRAQLRRFYFTAWRKYRLHAPMEPMERLVAEVIARHPEYHGLFEKELGDEEILGRDYLPEMGETNPFLHLGLHLGLLEQVSADRPAGIAAIFHELARHSGDPHEAEHRMMECLAEMIWQAQRNGAQPDEAAYLERLRGLGGGN
ncbi:MAG TPA: DUF1841 family protein [Gammaproteobacteria bacterium]|nr:DUF1841 family protein [Gammaproteobacteria bacterium]